MLVGLASQRGGSAADGNLEMIEATVLRIDDDDGGCQP